MTDPITPEEKARWRENVFAAALLLEYRTAIPRLLDRVEALEVENLALRRPSYTKTVTNDVQNTLVGKADG